MNNLLDVSNYLHIPAFLLALIGVWSIIWKGIALWKSAGYKDKVWFIIFLIINTVGILEILYIFVFSKREYKNEKPKEEK